MHKPPALIPIDIQKAFHDPFWGPRNNPQAELRMEELFKFWREKKWPIFHVQHLSVLPHSPLHPTHAGVEFMDFAKPLPGEPVFQKSVNSGFIGTHLETALRQAGVTDLVLLGFTSDHCVSTTTRMAANLGFRATVSADAVVAFDRKSFDGKAFSAQQMHEASLASLHEEFATVMSQSDLLKSLSMVL
jgi:nicotinamidase-related amidase